MTDIPAGKLDLERLRSIGHLGQRTRTRVIAEGRAHPDSGEPYVTRRDENGHDTTEHGKAGSGVSNRQDVSINNVPPIHLDMREYQ